MDRALDPAFVAAQKRRRVVAAAVLVTALFLAFSYGPSLLRPSVPRSRVRVEKVDRGPVEASVAASGTVTPDLEEVIASPVDARVTRILKRAGDPIKPGEAILDLDLSEQTVAFDKLERDVELKRNDQRRTRLDLQSRLADLDATTEAKRLEVESLRARLAQQTELAASGLVSKDGLREAQLNEAKAALELKRLLASRSIAEEMTKAQIDGMNLELATLESQRREARRVLDLGSTRVDRSSVVTWAVTEAGALVRRGEPLARLSDLKSFRIEATVSAVHGRSLRAGLQALVRIGKTDLRGEVSTVEPTVRDGVMRLWIRLAEPTHAVLRPSLKADVYIVTDRRADAVRVARGPFLTGEGSQDVFVVRDGVAARTRVDLGLIGYDAVEISRGVQPGDELIVSDMTNYLYARELKLK
ncbi:MAG: efflux RND transporter periplasmic adaptor subunit [Vicinamibacteria bacterium]|nr:efflux RND transporter periplasmic adaptor subunit [Vicinamibacteria bacterium]